jgi:two-component system cell cycle sensor histidine kinase/response regulator CckA
MSTKPTYKELEKKIQGLEQRLSVYEESEKKPDITAQWIKSFFERSLDCIFINDFEGNFLDANETSLNLLGYSRDEILSLNYGLLVVQESQLLECFEALDSLIKTGTMEKLLELELRRKDGESVYVEVKSLALYQNEMPYAVLGIARDITKRKKAEKNLQESEERLRILSNNVTDILWIYDLNQERFTHFSPSIETNLGWTVEEGLELSYEKMVTPDSLELSTKILEETLTSDNSREPRSVGIEVEHYRKDGTNCWAETTFSFLYDENGDPAFLIGATRDISERKKAQEALRKSEEQYRLLVENANDAIFIVQDEVIKFPNPKTIELTGYSEKELERIKPEQLIHAQDIDNVLLKHKKRLKGNKTPSSYSFRMVNKAGKLLWVQQNAALINWDDKPAVLVFLRNITSQKKLETQLQQAKKMESLGTLAGGIAHDFNNILGSIVLNTEMAVEDTLHGSDIRHSLKQVLKSSLRAKELVQQILTFSRSSTEDKREPINATTIVQETLKMLRPLISPTVIIQQDISPEAGTIMADATQIQQLVINLCTNAAQAMEEHGGTLKVDLKPVNIETASQEEDIPPDSYVQLSVIDTGSGIEPENMHRIFDPFFTTKEPGKGTGLGLSVIHGIVVSHGGQIKVDSKKNRGTVFNVFLPITDETITPAKENGRTLSAGCEKILVVDDEAVLADAVKRILERSGYKVDTALTGANALELFGRHPESYNLVITDMKMPLMTGAELSKKFRKIRADIPIIISTGYDQLTALEKAVGTDIDAYLIKPFVKKEITKTIRQVLDSNEKR